jgi:hypothetical protein
MSVRLAVGLKPAAADRSIYVHRRALFTCQQVVRSHTELPADLHEQVKRCAFKPLSLRAWAANNRRERLSVTRVEH